MQVHTTLDRDDGSSVSVTVDLVATREEFYAERVRDESNRANLSDSLTRREWRNLNDKLAKNLI